MIPMNSISSRCMLVALIVLACCLSGCSIRVADLTLVSTKNVDLSDVKIDMRQGKRVTGEDCAVILLGLIPLGVPNLEEAVDNALEKGNGNIMVDQVTHLSGFYYILAAHQCIEVEGTVVNIAEKK